MCASRQQVVEFIRIRSFVLGVDKLGWLLKSDGLQFGSSATRDVGVDSGSINHRLQLDRHYEWHGRLLFRLKLILHT
jgi:hypothetical protein